MKLEQGVYCPLLKKDCIKNKCAWFTQVRGYNPNTGREVDEWSCAVAWLPTLMIENSQQQRHTCASVDALRNETTKALNSKINPLIGESLIEIN
jgi:hypothetical protein